MKKGIAFDQGGAYARRKRHVESLSDHYVKAQIVKDVGPGVPIPPELIAMQREAMANKRLLASLNQQLKEKSCLSM